jgi:hypothetical protein
LIRASHQVTIHRRPEEVLFYFADLRNEPHWNRGHVRSVTLRTAPPIGLGAEFEGHHPGFGRATWRLVEFVPPRRIAIEGEVGSGSYRYFGLFTPENGSTRLHGVVEWEPGGALRFLSPLLTLLLRWQAGRSFRNLRRALERSS